MSLDLSLFPDGGVGWLDASGEHSDIVLSTRIRLADTQHVVAICEMSDGSFWSDKIEVIITLGACLEDLI